MANERVLPKLPLWSNNSCGLYGSSLLVNPQVFPESETFGYPRLLGPPAASVIQSLFPDGGVPFVVEYWGADRGEKKREC